MNRKLNRTNRNYIIIGLCAILVIMGVGYAAFSSQLKISGTSNIASNFLVKITSITPNSIIGTAENKTEVTTYNDTSATFGVSLKSPGDSITYDITIVNQGTIDAVLKTITKTDASNSAILFETSGVNEGDELNVGETATMKVKVTYNPNVTSQPNILDSTLKMTLDYAQKGTEVVPGANNILLGGKEVEVVTSGDGLYTDEYEAGRYIYRGQNPNNYITFNGETWRIIAKEQDGTYKIIKEELLEPRVYDEANRRTENNNNTFCDAPESGCSVYAAIDGEFITPSGRGTVTEDSSIKIYLNDDYYVNNINSTAKEQMIEHSFNIGAVEYFEQGGVQADSMEKNIAGEKMYTWTGNVGLANVTDILKASTNPLCTSFTASNDNPNGCNDNYLVDRPIYYWTINPYASDTNSPVNISNGVHVGLNNDRFIGVTTMNAQGGIDGTSSYSPRPVVFLKSTIQLEGSGSESDAFRIVSY